MDDLFTAWPELTKSMTQKEKALRLAEILDGKTAQDITFTAIDDEGSTQQYVLGTIEGNTKFLLGYANPGFYFAQYHLQVMDPSLSDTAAKVIFNTKGHPSILEFWSSSNVAPFAEGDVAKGKPHPDAPVEPKVNNVFKFKFRGKKYEANPDTQLVTCVTTDHTYAWALVQNTFLSSQVPKMALYMDPASEPVKKSMRFTKKGQYDDSVWPLVRSKFPPPGSILKSGSTLALFNATSVSFYDLEGNPEEFSAWDQTHTSLDLTKSGNVWPCAIINFASSFLKLDIQSLEQFVND